MASQSLRMYAANSAFSRHLSQVGSSVNLSLERCHFGWQCPVNSPTTHLNWSLFNFNRSFILFAEGSACLSPIMDNQCFLWFPFFQFFTRSWQIQLRWSKQVQVLWMDDQIPFLPADLAFHYQQYPYDLAPISVELCYVWPVVWGTDVSPRPVLRWSGIF
jgi:hypothetical protein